MVLPDQHLPLGPGHLAGTLPRPALLVDVPLAARLAKRVRARVGRIGEHLEHLVIARSDPPDLRTGEAPERELELLLTQPQPHLVRRAELREPIQDRPDRATHSLVRIEQDLPVSLAPDKPDGQRLAQLTARRLVTDPAIQPLANHVQLRLTDSALHAQQQPVIKRARVIQPVKVTDHNVSNPTQIK